MKVILLQNIQNIGKKYDIKKVSDGFAQNFLFPKKLAELSNPKTLARITLLKNKEEAEKKMKGQELIKNFKKLEEVVVNIKAKANKEGVLFASINTKDIAEELNKQYKIEIPEEFIILNKPIKEIGELEITIEIEKAKAIFKLIIEAQN